MCVFFAFSDKGRGRKNTSTVPKVKKVVKTPAPAPPAASSPPSPPSPPAPAAGTASLASLRKKASKRSASVAALAAITTSQEAETAAEDEENLFKPQQLEAKKKAVAIVRPQPQQPTLLQASPKPQRNLQDLQPQTNNRKTEKLVEDHSNLIIEEKKNRNISSGVTQPHSSEIQIIPREVDQTSNVGGDREARFSLYDFPSDSESEEKPLSQAQTSNKSSSTNKQQQQNKCGSAGGDLHRGNPLDHHQQPKQGIFVGPAGVISSSTTKVADLNKKSSSPSTTYVKKFFPKKSKLQLEKQPPPNNNSKELLQPASDNFTSPSSKNDVDTLQEEDEVAVVQPTTGKLNFNFT